MPQIVDAYHRVAPCRVRNPFVPARQTSRMLVRSRPTPGENQTDNADLLSRTSKRHATRSRRTIAVSERSAGQRADRPGTRRHVAAPPAALPKSSLARIPQSRLEPGAGDHLSRAAIERFRKYLRPRPVKLLDEKDYDAHSAGRAVRGVDIDSRDDPTGHRIPQPFQRGRSRIVPLNLHTHRRGPARGGSRRPRRAPERRDLTGNRIVARLTVARHARIERDATPSIMTYLPSPSWSSSYWRGRTSLGFSLAIVRRVVMARGGRTPSIRCWGPSLVASNENRAPRARGRSVRRAICASPPKTRK